MIERAIFASRHALAVFCLLLFLPGAAAWAEELDGAKLYFERTCIACHGPDAKTPILPEYPKLAGQNAPYMLQQMKDIKSGARSNGNTAAMRGVSCISSTKPEMEVLAEYISEPGTLYRGRIVRDMHGTLASGIAVAALLLGADAASPPSGARAAGARKEGGHRVRGTTSGTR